MRAADVLAERLYDAGCRYAFGMPGGEVLTLLDALEKAGIQFVLAKHENAAGFMAEATWHATGAPGILLATVGPGILNAVNVAENARQDRVPLIFISGCVDPDETLTYTHQVLDQTKLFGTICKQTFKMTPGGVGAMSDKAIALALDGRPGPIHIDVPVSVAAAKVDPATVYNGRRALPAATAPADSIDLRMARDWLRQAERPLVIVGYDAILDGSAKQVADFCQTWKIPLLATYKAKGILPEDHELAVGSIALSPIADKIALPFVADADLIVLAGYDPIEMRVGWKNPWDPQAQRVVEFVTEPNDHYMHHVSLSFVCHVGAGLNAISGDGPNGVDYWPDGQPAKTRSLFRTAFRQDQAWGPGPIADEISKSMSAGALLTVDSGAHRIVASQVLELKAPRALLQSMGLCTMGCAVPLAAGAKIAEPEREVIALVGDGGLMMILGELSTLADHQIPITIVVFVDRSLALIELKQRNMQLGNRGVDFDGHYDYEAIARAFGGTGVTVTDRGSLTSALQEARSRLTFTLIAAEFERGAYDGAF